MQFSLSTRLFIIGMAVLGLIIAASTTRVAVAQIEAQSQAAQVQGFSSLTEGQINALRCRGVDPNQLAGGMTTAQALRVLGINSSNPSAGNDWCLYLEQRAPSRGEPKTYSVRGGAVDYNDNLTSDQIACTAAREVFERNEASGNQFASVDVQFDPKFGQCLADFIRFAESSGYAVRITSGVRTAANQEEIWARSCSATGFLAANPNRAKSNHNRGIAADLSFSPGLSYSGRVELAQRSGVAVTFPHSNDTPHLQAVSAACNSGSGPAGTPSGTPTAQPTQPTTQQPTQTGTGGGIGDILTTLLNPNSAQPVTNPDGTQTNANPWTNIISSLFGGGTGNGGSTGGSSGVTTGGSSGSGTTANIPSSYYVAEEAGTSDYLILTEDGAVVTRSNSSADDALSKLIALVEREDTAGTVRQRGFDVTLLLESATDTIKVLPQATSTGGFAERTSFIFENGHFNAVSTFQTDSTGFGSQNTEGSVASGSESTAFSGAREFFVGRIIPAFESTARTVFRTISQILGL